MKSIYDYYSEIITHKDIWTRKKIRIDSTNVEELFFKKGAYDFAYTLLFSEGAAFLNRKEIRIPDGRIQHTISSFLLGILIKDNLSINIVDMPKPTGNYQTSFIYFWLMICLHHDIAYTIENKSKEIYSKIPTISDFVKKYDIKYNMLDETKDKLLFEQYYKYRVDCGNGKENPHIIDHGIVCGLLLYDTLMAKYYEDINVHSTIQKDGGYDFSESWKYSDEYPKYALKVCETIARHNIWVSNDKTYSIYEKYDLNELIKKSFNREESLCESNKNLLVLFGLVDTIEPIKCFCKKDDKEDYFIEDVSIIIDTLKNLKIDFDSRNKEMLIESSQHINNITHKKWYSLKNWLNIDVELCESTIKLNIPQVRSAEE